MRFQNRSNEVVIEIWVVQFWSEIILVISNQTCIVYWLEFDIACMISDHLHSTQLYHYLFHEINGQEKQNRRTVLEHTENA